MSRRPQIVLGVCGGIAAYKAIEVVRGLRERGADVRCALTSSAKSFVTPLVLEVLSGHAVYEQEYLRATGRGEESHVVLAQWADVVCIAPATANFLSRLALGLADDFLTTTAMAYGGPIVVAPAMHSQMWTQEALRGHVDTLRRRGVVFAGPEEGRLASGEWGMGRLVAPAAIVEAVMARAQGEPPGATPDGPLVGRTVVVSAGPTWEPIDPVRFLGNRSSGKMGFALAAEAARRGARTVLVSGPVSLETPPGTHRVDVMTALEMRDAVYEHAARADVVIMTAAVADFRPRSVAAQKIKKNDGIPSLELETNPDILAGLAEVAPGALRIGFAAETRVSQDEAYAKLKRKASDFLVWNNVATRGIGFGADDNEVTVYRRGGDPIELSRRPKSEIAVHLVDLIEESLEQRAREPEQILS